MKVKYWEITTKSGPFKFYANDKALAHSHAMTLRNDTYFTDKHGAVLVSDNVNEKVRAIAVRFVGWVEGSSPDPLGDK